MMFVWVVCRDIGVVQEFGVGEVLQLEKGRWWWVLGGNVRVLLDGWLQYDFGLVNFFLKKRLSLYECVRIISFVWEIMEDDWVS